MFNQILKVNHSVLKTWKSLPSRKSDNKETLNEVILQNVQKSNDCADKRNDTLNHEEQLTLFRVIVTFLFTCTGMLGKMIINTTVHAVVQAIVNIEEKIEGYAVELSIKPAGCKYLFKSETII